MKAIICSITILTLLVSCSEEKSGEEESKDEEQHVQAELTADEVLEDLQELASNTKVTKQIVDQMVSKTTLFYQSFPEHEMAPEVLFMTAANVQMIGERGRDSGAPQVSYFQKSVKMCDIIIDNYPEYRDVKLVYSLKATLLDIELEMNDEAIEVYQYLIDTYPEDTFNVVNNWQSRIDNIDVNPLDLILGS